MIERKFAERRLDVAFCELDAGIDSLDKAITEAMFDVTDFQITLAVHRMRDGIRAELQSEQAISNSL